MKKLVFGDPLIHACPLFSPQGVISAAKELDYEISHGRYTLTVTATDQCPILSQRLTSVTTVGGWDTAQGEDRAQEALTGKGQREACPGETPKSKSPVLVLATQPNLLCDLEELTELLCMASSVRQMMTPAFSHPALHGKGTNSGQTNRRSSPCSST